MARLSASAIGLVATALYPANARGEKLMLLDLTGQESERKLVQTRRRLAIVFS
jgi:hypothetical protein